MKTDLLQKIENLFFENAFSELSMDDIAANLGMKKASLYYHFSSKEAMFLEVLTYSYERYERFLEEVFKEDLPVMIKSLILYPFKEKNLYSIILQRGYCKIESIKKFISQKILINQKYFYEGIGTKFGLSQERIVIFRSIIDDLSKKYSILGCPSNVDFDGIINEIVFLFFKK